MNKIIVFILTLYFFVFQPLLTEEKKLSKEEIIEIVKKLGDENYSVRENATKELTKVSLKFTKLLTEEMQKTNDLEIKERLQYILEQSEEKLTNLFSESIMRGKQFLSNNQYEEALKEVENVLEIRPDYKLGILLKFRIYEAKGDINNSILTLTPYLEALDKSSNEFDDLGTLFGNMLLYNCKYAEAVKHLEIMEAYTRFPDRISPYLDAAYELNNQHSKSEERLQKELSEKPNDPYSKSLLAWFYIRTGKLTKSLPLLKDMESFPIEGKIQEVLNYLFLDENQTALEKLQVINDPLLKKHSEVQSLSLSELTPVDILRLCYQYYFQKTLKVETNIDFKKLYNAYSQEEKIVWPVPLLGLYSGEISKEKMEELLQTPNQWEFRKNICEAWFYLGLLKITENNTKDAKKYFQLSKDQKVYDYVETTASCFFLQTLK